MGFVGYQRTPVIAIGASAGGIEAFQSFFETMPPTTGFAVVVMLHLPVNQNSLLSELIRRWTSMNVVDVKDGQWVEPNTVYIPRSGVGMTFRGGRLYQSSHIAKSPRETNPISAFLTSLALDLKDDAVGIVLSGTGSDGAVGLKAIKEHGGLTLVQGSNGTRPQHEGMPFSAIATGAVDIVVPVEEMSARILAVRDARAGPDNLLTMPKNKTDAARLSICAILNNAVGHDFSGYKDKTFLRRVQRRMQVLGLNSLEDFVARLEADHHEAVMLFHDLLIGVTSFFRDESTFEIIQDRVLPRLFEGRDAYSTIRVWVPGCSTGEEAYTLAILMREHLDRIGADAPKVQIFATDIDEPAISTARSGRYTADQLQGMPQSRLSAHFIAGVDGSYTIAKPIRELCTFSVHSLTRDPPFSRIDLLSCRNLLIYLDLEFQGIVFPAFHYSLVPAGILLLGSSETASRYETLFDTVDRSHRIFQKRDVPSPPLRLTGRHKVVELQSSNMTLGQRTSSRTSSSKIGAWANALIMERFAPPHVIVTVTGEALYYSQHLQNFFELPSGAPSQNILAMARAGLRAPLRDALKECAATGRNVERADVLIQINPEHSMTVNIVVEPGKEFGAEAVFLVVFTETREDAVIDVASEQENGLSNPNTFYLEAELRDAREQLQSIQEEHDTALEELKSANEELHSVNEELQSTNEELETSKEEIQSINEELQTVNGQLSSKVDELDRNNSDLRNLFESTQVATVFLDQYMVIRSFTPAIASLYNLIPSDQGRPLTDIVSHLRYMDLREDCQRVLQTLEPLERRVVRDDDRTHYLMRILPYRTPLSDVDGTIVTFVDVSSVVQAEKHQKLLVDELNYRVKNMLTVVIAMASQTLSRSQTLGEFEANYMGRVHALAATYSLLGQEGWQAISLETLLIEEMKPFRLLDHDNITLKGPHVLLQPRAALALGMAVHELMTNAVKHGAMSVPEGTVDVSWKIKEVDGTARLLATWVERNGPRVTPPSQTGFGMTLIEHGLKQEMAADVALEFPVSGVRATLSAPLADIQGDHASPIQG